MTYTTDELRGLADFDARSGEPLGRALRWSAEEIERLQAIIAGSAEQARVGFSSKSTVVMRQALNVIHTALDSVRRSKPCPRCDGAGFDYEPRANRTAVIDCPDCWGSGELNSPGEIAEGGPSHPCPCTASEVEAEARRLYEAANGPQWHAASPAIRDRYRRKAKAFGLERHATP